MRVVRNPDYWKKGFPYLDGIDFKVIDNRSTRLLAFIAGEFDLTFHSDVTIAGLKDVASQAPKATCQLLASNNTVNMIVNSGAAPFDNLQVRKAMALALDLTVDRASDALAEMDWTYETCNKSQAPAAWLKIRDVASKSAESLAARLGLSPADRSRIIVKRPDGKKGKLASVQDRTQRGAGTGSR